MYKKLVLYRNELKNSMVPTYKLIGITAELLLSREIFPKNSQIEDFLNDVFRVKYKTYVMKSRTLMVARCCKVISTCEEKEYNIYKRGILKFVNQEIELMKKESDIKSEKNQFDGWLK